ncbi:FAD-dependent monooxygenase, partial [Brevibacterium sp. SIMBA_078]|uniref:FAD-dependent monooxygenase n=1 Tax=Brevibacterium sp. SIMBA_078 TaxID=3085816 RepID=UPI00397AEFA3
MLILSKNYAPLSILLSFNYNDEAENEQQLRARVLVACDGRDSTVRQLLDIGTTT